MKFLIKVLLWGSLVVITILSIGILFWRNYPLELLSNFRVYYLFLAGLIAIALFICQLNQWRFPFAFRLALGLVVFNSVWVLPWYLPHRTQPIAGGEPIRVMSFNINFLNHQWNTIANTIRYAEPDVAVLIESSVLSKDELSKRLLDTWPFVYRTSGGNFTIFSKLELISPLSETFDTGTFLVTSLQVRQKVIDLIAVHPLAPVKPVLFERRSTFLKQMVAYLRQRPSNPLILLGDFNLTPWSPYYTQFIQQTRLHNTRLGFGVEPSWVEPTTHLWYPRLLTTLLKIPIDHIFVSSDIRVKNCKTMRSGNSDHRPVWSDLVL